MWQSNIAKTTFYLLDMQRYTICFLPQLIRNAIYYYVLADRMTSLKVTLNLSDYVRVESFSVTSRWGKTAFSVVR